MTILSDPLRGVFTVEDEPTALDRAYAAETSPFAGESHEVDAPTPLVALTPPWYEALPWSVDLDMPVEEPEAFAPRRRVSRRVTDFDQDYYGRPARYLADDELIDRLGSVEYPD